MEELASKLNGLLASGKTVVVSTHANATKYGPKWSGCFVAKPDGNLYVLHGKRSYCLSAAGRLIVGIQVWE